MIDKGYGKIILRILISIIFVLGSLPAMPVAAEEIDKTIRIGYVDFEDFIYQEESGVYSGYGVEYLEEIADYTGWHYEYVYDTWQNQLRNLAEGKIDFICHAQKTPEREEEFLFSQYEVASESNVIYARSDDERYYFNDFTHFDGMKIALLKNSIQNDEFKEFAEEKGFTYTFQEYDTREECFAALDEQIVDGVAIGTLELRPEYKEVARFGTDPLYFITGKQNQTMMNELNDALGQILVSNSTFGMDLFEEYYEGKNDSRNVMLTRQEMEYIAQSDFIPIAFLPNRAPYSCENKKGEPEGITVDVLKLLEEKSGLRFQMQMLPAGMLAVDYIKKHPDTVIAGVQIDNPQFLTKEYLVSDKLFTGDVALACKKEMEYDLTSSKRTYTLAISKSYAALKMYITDNYKQFEIVECKDSRECLRMVQRGEADFAAQNIDVLTPIMQDPHYEDMVVIPTFFMEEHCGLVCNTNSDNHILMNILNKCIASITEKELSQITAKHIITNRYQMNGKDVLYKYRYPIAAIFLLVIMVVVLMNILSVQRKKGVEKIQEKNRQLSEAVTQADHASRAKSRFLAHMSHEIRTPLNAIVGLTTIARHHEEEPDKLEEYLLKIEQSSKILLNIINDVLDMSAIESEKLKMNYAPFNIKEILNGVSEIYAPQCKQKGIRYQMSTTGIIHEQLVGDGLRLSQVLLNLVSNAYKFTPRGGTIKIIAQELERRGDKAFFKIVVKDNGEGMTEEVQKRLFQPFEQESVDTASKHRGSGLGLSISKNLLEMMHGSISCKSEKGKGTRFQIAIPIEIADSDMDKSAQDYRSIQALIVDDDVDTREYTSIILERVGVSYTIAASDAEAIEIMQRTKEIGSGFDICFVDWYLSDKTGADVVRKLRELFQKDILIVIVSACDAEQIQQEATEAGADIILSKPLFQSTVFNLLTRLSKGKFAQQAEAEKNYNFEGKRVLLAEDIELNAEITMELLHMVHMDVDYAKNGKEVVRMFEEAEPGTYEAILMDIQMPEMDGYEATKAIRTSVHADAKTIPIFAITANAFTEDVSKALNSGMNGHIAKPVDVNVLYATLYRVVQQNKFLQRERDS